jgi:murein L,D-transpeptidase YcbB/YkuD
METSFAAEPQLDPAVALPLDSLLEQRAAAQAKPPSLEEIFDQLRQDKTLRHGPLLAYPYRANKHAPLFFQDGALVPAGQTLLERLRAAKREGLDPDSLHLAQLEEGLEQLRTHEAWLADHRAKLPTPTPSEQARMRDASQKAPPVANAAPPQPPPTPGGDVPVEQMVSSLLDPAHGVEPGGVVEWYEAHRKGIEARAELGPKLDLLMSDALLTYAREMKYENPYAYVSATKPIKKKTKDTDPTYPTYAPAPDEETIHKGLATFFQDLLQARQDPAKLDSLWSSLEPQTGQYRKLTQALARYEELAAKGGWPTDLPLVPPGTRKDPIRYTREAPPEPGVIPALKRRLAAEGLYEGPTDTDEWSDAFDKALIDYSYTHQLSHDPPTINYDLVENMRVPVEWRVAQIKVTLEQWRKTRTVDDPYFVFVNLPDFHAEIWDKGERMMRFKVVVGSDETSRSETKGLHFPNETPQISGKFETLIFNPFWTVPKRIQRELDRKAAKDPDYYNKHNYEVVDGALRQKPGSKNALGRVKFLFPNDYDVYMHDTAEKKYFDRTFRAYSHGCMRVHNPYDFATFLLQREDPSWTLSKVKGQAESSKQFRYDLDQGPSIHIEYYTVQVDDEGKVQFLADIYNRAAKKIEEEHGLTFAKREPPKPEKKGKATLTPKPAAPADPEDNGP